VEVTSHERKRWRLKWSTAKVEEVYSETTVSLIIRDLNIPVYRKGKEETRKGRGESPGGRKDIGTIL